MEIEDFKDSRGLWVKTVGPKGYQNHTKSFSRWDSMASRCKLGGSVQRRQQTYVGCAMSAQFSDFQEFTNWAIGQVGYNESDYHLDKDILVLGNKLYSEDTCVFVPKALNAFLIVSKTKCNAYPRGVGFCKQTGMFRAALNVDGKVRCAGRYATAYAAGEAYKSAKEAEARRWHRRLESGEFAVDSRVIERMKCWTLSPISEKTTTPT